MKHGLKYLFTAGAILAGLALAVFLLLPGMLAPHAHAFRRVKPKFKTPQEEKDFRAQAEALDEPVFKALYEDYDSADLHGYLPPRGSAAHGAVTVFSKFLDVKIPAAAREDLLPSPPAPKPDLYVDDSAAYPMHVKAVDKFLGWFQIAAGAGFAVCLALALLFLKLARTPPQTAKH